MLSFGGRPVGLPCVALALNELRTNVSIWRIKYFLLSGLFGAGVLCALSCFQKLLIAAPLTPKGFIVPSGFGFLAGAAIGLWHTKVLMLKRELESHILRQSDQLREIFDFAPVGIFQFTLEGRYRDINGRFAAMLGYEREDLLQGDIHFTGHCVDSEDCEAFKRLLAEHGEMVDRHIQLYRKDGSRMWMSISATVKTDAEGDYFDGFSLDITGRKRAEDQLKVMATTDELTGIFNRRCFMEVARKEVERSTRFKYDLAFIMFDVDRFKNVNDTYGHDVGDEVLRLLSSTAGECLRAIDVLARIGGEEFAALLPETDQDGALLVAERIRKEIEDMSVSCPQGEVRVTVSLGLAMFSGSAGGQLGDLMKASDKALYRAKDNGRNRVEVYSPESYAT
ncbi:MAG: sensor domain-containing diguanylate cyclase [Thermodesulfobacteriota bacterium]|nr:sensor domain-containing diguanylate cyclase [Thermodesulfobacteriota bacterium]